MVTERVPGRFVRGFGPEVSHSAAGGGGGGGGTTWS